MADALKPGKDDDDHEGRKSRRQRTLLSGRIMFLDKHSVMNCIIKNKSDTGCQLSVESHIGIPDQFYLQSNTGECHLCKVVWRSRDRIGVEFVPQ